MLVDTAKSLPPRIIYYFQNWLFNKYHVNIFMVTNQRINYTKMIQQIVFNTVNNLKTMNIDNPVKVFLTKI